MNIFWKDWLLIGGRCWKMSGLTQESSSF